jgi:putative ribosome biogenesis GTPase RsgA
MAKYKGKSRRRMKNLDEHAISDRDEDAAMFRQGFSERAVNIPSSRLEAPDENLEDLPKTEGMVTGFFPGGAIVRVDGQEFICGIAKTFRAPEDSTPLAVGDIATVALAQHAAGDVQTDKVRADGFIIARRPRRTVLARPRPTSGKRQDVYDSTTFQKIIVANVQQLLIVASSRQPGFRQGLIDRLLSVAERGEL